MRHLPLFIAATSSATGNISSFTLNVSAGSPYQRARRARFRVIIVFCTPIGRGFRGRGRLTLGIPRRQGFSVRTCMQSSSTYRIARPITLCRTGLYFIPVLMLTCIDGFWVSGLGTNETLGRCCDRVHMYARSFPSEGPTMLQVHIVCW